MTFLKRVLSGCYIILVAATSPTALHAAKIQPADGDWPRWMGPRGNGVASASGMIGEGAEFDVRWRRPIGSGYSAVSVAGDRAITMAADGGVDQVLALDAGTGAELWRHSMGPTHLGHDGSHDGPMSTPTIDENRVFALSTSGRLVALDLRPGKELWSKELVDDLEGVAPYYGFSTSPLVADGRVLILAGGKGRNNLVAFDKATGERAWSADHGNEGTHASPIIGTVAGVRQVIVPAGDRVYAVSPTDGNLLWSFEETSFAGLLLLPGDRVLLGAEIRDDVQSLLEDEVNPAVERHGGKISLVDVKGAVVYITMSGGCQGCGAASVTLKQGVEVMIREQIPEVVQIIDATDHAAGENPFYTPSK